MAKKPKLNVPLFKRILKHLREEPKRYYQPNWGRQISTQYSDAPACGTQGCIAGWAVLLNVPQELWQYLFDSNAFTASRAMGPLSSAPITPVAQRLLGLTADEAIGLFSSSNQLHGMGEAGVKEAAAKINLLIKDRAKFVKEYGRYGR